MSNDKPCHYHLHTDGKKYFIPGCIGAAVIGKHACTCPSRNGVKLTNDQMIVALKEEIEFLKSRLKEYEKGNDNC